VVDVWGSGKETALGSAKAPGRRNALTVRLIECNNGTTLGS